MINLLTTTNNKGQVIEVKYCSVFKGYEVFVDGKETTYNMECYLKSIENTLVDNQEELGIFNYYNTLLYVLVELNGFEELRELLPIFDLKEDWDIILDVLADDMDLVTVDKVSGDFHIYDYRKKEIVTFYSDTDHYYDINLGKIIGNEDCILDEFTKEEFLRDIVRIKEFLNGHTW
jgi:hypothetical protein